MEYRFDQVLEISDMLTCEYLYGTPDYNRNQKGNEGILRFTNTLPYDIERTMVVELRFLPEFKAVYYEPFGYEKINAFKIYDKDGNVLERGSSTHKQTNTYENGKLVEIHSQYGDVVYKTLYEYDGELLLSLINYENGTVTNKYTYEYDQDGDRIKETFENGLGIASSITEFYYDEFVVEE